MNDQSLLPAVLRLHTAHWTTPRQTSKLLLRAADHIVALEAELNDMRTIRAWGSAVESGRAAAAATERSSP